MSSSCSATPEDAAASREFEAFLRTQDPVDVAATTWHTRCEQGLTSEEESEFQWWLSSNPAHAAAFTHLERSIKLLRNLPAEQLTSSPKTADQYTAARPTNAADFEATHRSPTHDQRPSPVRRKPRWRWRQTAGMLCCATVIAIGVAWQLPERPIFSQSYVVERGFRQDVRLPDGSQLLLDADTKVKVKLYDDRREVQLERGQAMFSVIQDLGKPFKVLAGRAQITVTGTRFSVRYINNGTDPGQVDIEVEQGSVQVDDAANDGWFHQKTPHSTHLFAGQSINVSPAGHLSETTPIATGNIAPWRNGLVRFTSTPLADALRELERYGSTGLLIRDPDVARLPIGGSYQIDKPSDFARVLPQILPVRLVRRGDNKTEIVKAN